MNRDELLTKLAMEMAEWPKDTRVPPGFFTSGFDVVYRDTGNVFTKSDWLDRRARLINKPSWDTVPKFLGWIAQDSDARWYGYRDKPRATKNLWFGGKPDVLSIGKIPAGHDWRETCEQRPASEDHEEPEWDGETWPPPINKACEYRCGEGSEWRQGTCVGYYNNYAVVVDEGDGGASAQIVAHVRPLRTAEQKAVDTIHAVIMALPDDTDTRVAAQDIYNAIRRGDVSGVGLTTTAYDDQHKAQRQARHEWDWEDGEGERCVKCGDKDWMAGPVCSEAKLRHQAEGGDSHDNQ